MSHNLWYSHWGQVTTIIEVKLASNPEARRAIVSQVLAYAAFLHGLDVAGLQQGGKRWLGDHLERQSATIHHGISVGIWMGCSKLV